MNNYFYIFGFTCWLTLLATRTFQVIPFEGISQFSAQIELVIHFFLLFLSFKIYKRSERKDKIIIFFIILFNSFLFLNDLFFYFFIYLLKNSNFNLVFSNFVLIIVPYSIWILSALILLYLILKDAFDPNRFAKLFSMLMLINIIIIFLFFYSVQPFYDYLSWQNLSQIISSLAELIIYDFCILCLIYTEKKWLLLFSSGLIALISGDFIISYSFLAQTGVIATYGELLWLLGIMLILYGMLELNNQSSIKNNCMRSISSIKSRLAFWAFNISIINVIPFCILAYLFSPLNKAVFLILPSFLMLTSVLIVILSRLTANHFETPFKRIESNIRDLMLENNNRNFNHDFIIDEFVFLQDFILNVFDIKKESEAAKQALISLALQVAHDIRSPLTSLNICLLHLTNLPEKQRVLMRNVCNRINDIANNLLQEYKDKSMDSMEKHINLNSYLITPLLENIISEKRLQFERLSIDIEEIITNEGFSAFSKLDASRMKRLLSNLINNSAESFSIKGGKITIFLDASSEEVFLKISDNGCGIPPALLDKVCDRGASFKEYGHGLGLPDAKENIEYFGGILQLDSNLNRGTTVHITLPRAKAPAWFVSEILVAPEVKIGILDDDESVHDAWDQRLFAISGNLSVYHFRNAPEFSDWCASQLSPFQVFSDYELLGESTTTGLDILNSLKLSNQATLVTSHYENNDIIDECQKAGIGLLPKNLLAHIPIKLISYQNIDLVLIDDSQILCDSWDLAANNLGKPILTCRSFKEFQNHLSFLSCNTPIYIDSDLGDKIGGEQYAKEIFNQGFQEIYLVTGYPSSHFGDMPWIRSIVDKSPPFHLEEFR